MPASSSKRAAVPLDGLALPESSKDLRCRHKSSSGRRCERRPDSANLGFCEFHSAEAQEFRDAESHAIAAELLSPESSLTDPASVNRLLGKLFTLVAQGRISVPTGALLTQIGQLILQTISGAGAHSEIRLSEVNNAWRQTIVHVLNSANHSIGGSPGNGFSYHDLEREIRNAAIEPDAVSARVNMRDQDGD